MSLKLRAARLAGNLITIFEGDFNMKNDKYLKIILTIIAICLIWICVRDLRVGSNEVYAEVNSNSQEEVYIDSISPSAKSDIQNAVWLALQLSQPIQVTVDSLDSQK